MDYGKKPLYKFGREVYYIIKQTENMLYNRNYKTNRSYSANSVHDMIIN